MDHEQGRQSLLMRWTSGRPVSMLVLFGLFLYIWIELRERLESISQKPDLNGDGVFNISDVPPAVYALLTTVGDNIQSTALGMRRAEIAKFLQMSADPPNPFWSILLSGFFYFLLFHFARKSLRKANPD
jgi:hypothetical protein